MSHFAAVKEIVSPQSSSDDFFTPIDRFLPWHQRYRFTLDPCGHPLSPTTQEIIRSGGSACILPDADGLLAAWRGHRVFCNPPYSNIEPWIVRATKAIVEGAQFVLMLLPATKSEQPWWQKYVESRRDGHAPALADYRVRTSFLPKRIVHGTPANPHAEPVMGPKGKMVKAGGGTFPSVLVLFEP